MSKTATNLIEDSSYHKMLAAGFVASGVGVTTLEVTKNKETILLVDTKVWHVYLDGIWYDQTT